MKKALLILGSMGILANMPVLAADLSIGDPKSESGELKLTGAIRTRYMYKDYIVEANEGSKNQDWQLADIKAVLSYENPNWIASMDVRCYQYSRLCDAWFLKDAWAGYKISDQQRLSVGFQSVDFGFGRLWGNSYYETLLNTVGLEDIQNLGLKYQFKNDQYNFNFGFYPADGGNYTGTSKDASRYSGNFIQADDLSQGTDIDEKNMWITRLSRKFDLDKTQNFSTEIGGSYWYSDLKNNRTHQDGHRRTWAIFNTMNYQAWQWLFLAGEQNIKNADNLLPDSSTMGAFDYPYQVANKGKFMSNEINYTLAQPFHQLENIKPYLAYSRYFKDQSGAQDSDRLTAGVYFNYKAIGIQGEYIWSRNDPMTGSGANGLAQGESNQWNKLFYLSLGYYF